MLRYLRMQAMQSTSDAARAMFKHGNFSFHPTTKDADQLPQETPPEILTLLQTGRQNYTEDGPKYLQVLWWEFPPLHREAVRVGSSMRFLLNPGTKLVPNPVMTPEQQAVVEIFVNELLDLGVLRKVDSPLRRVCPLFVVAKAGQPGQWRCIADMCRGGQNKCCSLDPVYLPCPHDTLPMLYTNGWTAIADASKYFHNNQTLPEERELIGIIHPTMGEHLWYVGLPMGSVNSPSIACRFGEGILNLLREESPVYRGVRRLKNTWRTALQRGKYNADIGHDYVFEQENGQPVAIVFGFVDDFFVHAATWSDCVEGLNAFMDLMVRLGLICQPVKTSLPAQVQKHCGFIYDTRGTPTLHIPPNKIARCIASAMYLKSKPRIEHLSHLSLAVVTGVLQSIVAATPQHSGQVHLRALYNDLQDGRSRTSTRSCKVPHHRLFVSAQPTRPTMVDPAPRRAPMGHHLSSPHPQWHCDKMGRWQWDQNPRHHRAIPAVGQRA